MERGLLPPLHQLEGLREHTALPRAVAGGERACCPLSKNPPPTQFSAFRSSA